jgi:hypothetical protein
LSDVVLLARCPAAEFRSPVGVAGLGVQVGVEACEPSACVVLAAFLLTVLGALELALVGAAGFGAEGASYAVSAGNRPAAEGPAHYPTGYFDSREQIYEWFAGR